MKKSFLCALVLVLSSFFFISINKVEAYEIEIENLDMITEDFFRLKELSEEYISTSTDYDNFIICLRSNKLTSILFKYNNSYDLSVSNSSLYFRINVYYRITNLYKNELSFNGGGNNFIFYDLFLYSSLDFNLGSGESLTLKYDNRYFTINPGEKLLSYYDIYKDNQYFQDPHLKEKEVISSFYTICISKISLLTERIASNYIYLSMIVVLILVFIIELIRRWLT